MERTLAAVLGFAIGLTAVLLAMVYWTVYCCCHNMLIGWCHPSKCAQSDAKDEEDLEAHTQNQILEHMESRRVKKLAAERDVQYRWREASPFRSPLVHPPDAVHAASSEQLSDKSFVLRHVASYGDALTLASPELKADFDVVRAACMHNGRALRYADASLKADRTVVLTAVTQNGRALKHASAEMQADRDVVVAAVKNKGQAALRYAHSSLKSDFGVHNAMAYYNDYRASGGVAMAPTTPSSRSANGGSAAKPVAKEAQPPPPLLGAPSASA